MCSPASIVDRYKNQLLMLPLPPKNKKYNKKRQKKKTQGANVSELRM